MLRPILRSAAKTPRQSLGPASRAAGARYMATQSGDDVKKPTALAKLHLEDGTTLIGKSFGSHESVEGEVRFHYSLLGRKLILSSCAKKLTLCSYIFYVF
jgi:hypothetical protein